MLKLKSIATAMLGSFLMISPSFAENSSANDVLATVDGRPLRVNEVTLAEEELYTMIYNVPDQQRAQLLIGFLIDRDLAAAAAQSAGISDDDPEIMARMAFYRKKAMQDVYLNRLLEERVSEDDIRAFYEKTITSQPPVEELKARHILLADEASAHQAAAAARAGQDFANLASERSIGPSKDNGGDLGYFSMDQMVPEFSAAANVLSVGEISDPVQTQFGWHVIKLEDRRIRPVPNYEDMVMQIGEHLASEAQKEIYQDLREKADIKFVQPQSQ